MVKPLRELAKALDQRGPNDFLNLQKEASHSEIKPLVQALNTLLDRVRSHAARERAFVQDAAHEIRTPLAVISAQAHVLGSTTDPVAQKLAQSHLEHAIERASHLADQLLSLASLDESRPPETRALDLAHWLRKLLSLRAPGALKQGIELALDAPDCLWVRIELATFESIVENLLDNAIRYHLPKGEVQVRMSLRGTELRLWVQDDGRGIASDRHEAIFERFHRIAQDQPSGTGLGLAIVKQAAQRLGGEVSVVQGLCGKGVGFLVRLNIELVSDSSV